MTLQKLQYTACHEAAHAVIAHRNGYIILDISLWPIPNLDRWEGVVTYNAQTWQCASCDVTLNSRHDPDGLSKLSETCSSCTEEKVRFVERCLAGGAATFVLEPNAHNPNDSDCDRIAALRLRQAVEGHKGDAFEIGSRQIVERVAECIQAVMRLRDRLVLGASKNCNSVYVLCGRDALAIICEPA